MHDNAFPKEYQNIQGPEEQPTKNRNSFTSDGHASNNVENEELECY